MKQLFLTAALLVLVTTVYTKLTFLFCCSEFFAVLEKLIKVVQNVKIHKKERPLLRNLFFNLFRCMIPEVFSILVLGRYNESTFSTYSIRVIAVVIFTSLVHFKLPKI